MRLRVAERKRTGEIREFILGNVASHPRDIVAVTMGQFGMSRQAVNRHVRALVTEGRLLSEGSTSDRSYSLPSRPEFALTLPVLGLEEDRVWIETFDPMLRDLPANVYGICQHGFTEMLNNVIDHSGSETVRVTCRRDGGRVELGVLDLGVGVFRKIKEALGLEDELRALLELAKGKLTTAPSEHSGEGIFFTSRAFDLFSLLSGELFFQHDAEQGDWLIEHKDDGREGTVVRMVIAEDSSRRLIDVFDEFAVGEDKVFAKTHVPVFLHKHGAANLVSRSQAKRLLSRFEEFEEVILDFDKVDEIGQAFADEIFRVYQARHPDKRFVTIRANTAVNAMIRRAKAKLREQQGGE